MTFSNFPPPGSPPPHPTPTPPLLMHVLLRHTFPAPLHTEGCVDELERTGVRHHVHQVVALLTQASTNDPQDCFEFLFSNNVIGMLLLLSRDDVRCILLAALYCVYIVGLGWVCCPLLDCGAGKSV